MGYITMKPDPVIQAVTKELSDLPKLSAEDTQLSANPYKSVAPQLLREKEEIDGYLATRIDPNFEATRKNLQNELHELEAQKLKLHSDLENKGLSHHEGNVQLSEINAKLKELVEKLNAIEREEETFTNHITDLQAKNAELETALKQIEGDEEKCGRLVVDLGEKKIQLAKQLAEVTREHVAQQNYLTQLQSHRKTVVDALAQVHNDSQQYQQELADLDEKRKQLDRDREILMHHQEGTEDMIRSLDKVRRELYDAIGNLDNKILNLQDRINNMVHPEIRAPERSDIYPEPLSMIPPVTKIPMPKELPIPAHSHFPEGYNKGRPHHHSLGPITVPQVVRGSYNTRVMQGVPVTQAKPLPMNDGYYKSTTILANSTNVRPSTVANQRGPCPTAAAPVPTSPPAAKGPMTNGSLVPHSAISATSANTRPATTGLNKPRGVGGKLDNQFHTTYQHSFKSY
eukprot:TRINITY_DN16202_c0_g1::TRINITY_DN16202_c0_g1_i1::g.6425::m.6425 TRINITY_DN16202_c0_g1::TRINITY_DN16202_c0_g1_i1::g.6425  ORF type:complete len:457 (+),score=134.57,Myosin_tail_1/PF01576.14/0.00022,EzrA/PF06160.7/0.00066,EzrA/PF06160.7/8.4,Taxilin/PF09728.4/0.01,AAA_13/PF13166.1/0.025,AAA_13/PF13166.1/5,Baculo_PEP_C/PF04513.7/1.6,Baculo_PEP_C/PF04513.7/0.41,APG6/PF04111.7/7.9,APG6/PF04111.7/0.13,Reo_sigmaC/PF04582.7/0.51,Reo_sigmaC/PF04582.7/0.38,Reo_sigmaC/PF04582.7/21,GAS/PF13851.1/1.4,GAS/PF13